MLKLFSVAEMIALEKEANASGLSYGEMMENAGRGIAENTQSAYSHLINKSIVAFVGSGNNGGDALVALSYLIEHDWETRAYIVRNRGIDDLLIKRYLDAGGKVISIEDDKDQKILYALLESCSVIIDGVFGTGIKLPLRGEIPHLLEVIKNYILINKKDIHVVAVDCPSGVDCDTGEAAPETIPANITVTMAGVKQGLYKFPAAELAGEIQVASIGKITNTSAYKTNQKIIVTNELVKEHLPKRPIHAHKGTFGTAFIIAGSENYTGAAFLSGMAAYRIGTGLVTMAVPAPLHVAIAGQFPEATWVLLPNQSGVISADASDLIFENISRASALLLGPGFGLENTTGEFLSEILNRLNKFGADKEINWEEKRKLPGPIPIVLDADGLKLVARIPNWYTLLPAPAILTPHPGEMGVITGLSVADIQNNRIEVAQEYASKWGHVVVLKGAFTLIAEPGGNTAVIPVATAALAKAGTGDVLAGLITGLVAQGIRPYQAAFTGAWIHAQAGLVAEKRLGNSASVLASDVLNSIPQVVTQVIRAN